MLLTMLVYVTPVNVESAKEQKVDALGFSVVSETRLYRQLIAMHVLCCSASVLNSIQKLNFPTFKMLFSFVAFFFTLLAVSNASIELMIADEITKTTPVDQMIQLVWFRTELTVLISIIASNVIFMLIRSCGKPSTKIDY